MVEAGTLGVSRPRQGEPLAKVVRLQNLQSTVNAMVKQALATSGRPSGMPTIVVASPMVQPLPGGSGSRLGPDLSAGGSGTSAAADWAGIIGSINAVRSIS